MSPRYYPPGQTPQPPRAKPYSEDDRRSKGYDPNDRGERGAAYAKRKRKRERNLKLVERGGLAPKAADFKSPAPQPGAKP